MKTPKPSRWGLLVVVVAAQLLVIPAQGMPAPSTFESTDGNSICDGSLDWATAPNLETISDRASGQGDNSLGQGTKEDAPVPVVVSGSVPNNKSDLSQFSIASENVAGFDFMYLRWTRANTLGNANIDFEFNASRTTSANGVTPVRTVGDILITFDFEGSGVELGLLTWVTTGPVSQCFASSSLPCWGNRVDLSASGYAVGSVNLTAMWDPLQGVFMPPLTFGEAAIDLTSSGIVAPGECYPFASAYLKSRSSTSFTASTKDFIAPQGLSFAACAAIRIHKTDDVGAPLAGADFTLYGGSPSGLYCSGAAVSPAVTCTTDAAGNCTMADIPAGTYCLAETSTPVGYSTANAQGVTVSSGGTTVPVSFTDPRLFHVITFVCRDSDDTLWPSKVSLGTVEVDSLQAGDLPAGLSPASLCQLPAARFDGLEAGVYSETITIP